MSTAIARDRAAGLSPRARARLAGVFQALEAFTSAGGQVLILGRLVVSGNAAATAANLLTHARLFWLGSALSLLAVPCHLAWALLLHDLLAPVQRTLSRFALLVIAVGCAVQAVTGLLYAAPMLVLANPGPFAALTPAQQQALAYAFVRLNGHAFATYLAFFGMWCALIGVLIARSRFLPRVLGVLMVLDGLGWMLYLHPPLAYQMFGIIATVSALAEIPLLLWLLVVGVNEPRWREQAAARGA